MDIDWGDSDCLGDPRSGSGQKEEERMVAPALDGCAIWRGNDRVEIFRRKIADKALCGPLALDTKHAARKSHCSRISKCNMLEEGVDSREADLARTNAVLAFLLKMVKKRKYDVTVEVLDRQAAYRPISLSLAAKTRRSRRVSR